MPYGQVTVFADMGDGPAVAVFDPVGGGEAKPSVVAAGDDHVSDTGPVTVGQETPRMPRACDRADARGHERSVRRPGRGSGRP